MVECLIKIMINLFAMIDTKLWNFFRNKKIIHHYEAGWSASISVKYQFSAGSSKFPWQYCLIYRISVSHLLLISSQYARNICHWTLGNNNKSTNFLQSHFHLSLNNSMGKFGITNFLPMLFIQNLIWTWKTAKNSFVWTF